MKKIFAFLMVLTLLTTVFSFNVVEAKSKKVSLTGEIIKVNQRESRDKYDVLALKCEDGNYILTGNIKGMSKYINSKATVNGNVYTFYKGVLLMKVKDYEIITEITPVVTVKPLPTPIEPVITQVPSPNSEELTGILFNDDTNKDRFLLKTEKGVYELTGNTKGLENEFGNTLLVSGDYVYTLVATEYPLFSVKSYTVIEKPVITPDPELEIVVGKLKVTGAEPIDENKVAYGYLLETQSGPVTLDGETKGLEKYDGLEVEVTGKYSMLKIYPPIFIVETYKLVSTPTPTSTPVLKTITMADNGGYVYVKTGEEFKLELETNPSTGYNWSYITKPDPDVLLETNYEFVPDNKDPNVVGSGGKGVWTYQALISETVVIEMAYSRAWESVEPLKTFVVKIIVEDLESITGKLTVTRADAVDENKVAYGYLLETQSGPVTLDGETKGLEKYDGLEVEVTGKYSMLKIYPPIFIVETYKLVSTPTPTSTPVVKTITMADNGGYVYVKTGEEFKLELETNPSTGYDWSYVRKPDPDVLLETNYEFVPDNEDPNLVGSGGKGVWTYQALIRETEVIEMAYSRPWESVEPLKTFIVKIIVEETATPTPTPTFVTTPKTHTLISEKAMYISLPDVQFTEVRGTTTISWTEGTDRAFFSSKLYVGKTLYEFDLVSVKESDSESIVGLFNIKKNGEILEQEIPGKLYGLTLHEGDYFKFYSEGEKYHMSAYITNRLDF